MRHGIGSVSRSAVILLAAVACACAPRVTLRVPNEAIARLPVDRQVSLLDAESDLLAAVDRRDAQEDKAIAAEEAWRASQARVREAEQRLTAQKAAKAPLEVAELVVREAEARVEVVENAYDVERAKLQVEAARLLVAQAQFETARAREVRDAGLAGGWGVDEPAFKAQEERLAAVVLEREATVAEVKAAGDEARKTWQAIRDELVQKSGGAQGSVWTP